MSSEKMPTVKGSNVGKRVARRRTESRAAARPSQGQPYQPLAIGILPDDVLLEIFDFYVDQAGQIEAWCTLVHVCRRWRHVVFGSPRRLNLRLFRTDRRPVRKMLDIWPDLPIVVWNDVDPTSLEEGADNVIAALEHNDRVYEINLGGVPSRLLERFAAVVQGPFPALTSLVLWSNDEPAPVLPESFLSGPAPHLRSLLLDSIPFPVLRKLPLEASNLVDLRLWDIPHSGYISPEAMVTCLAALTRLEAVDLEFHSPRSRPSRASRRPPPLTRVVLPVLTSCRFQGVSEYLEDLVARIDVPLLSEIAITFFNQLIFNTPQLLQFISRVERLKALNQANVVFFSNEVVVRLSEQTEAVNHGRLAIGISCAESDWQLSSLAQVCSSSLPPLTTLERLDIREDRRWRPHWQEDVENAQWLELVHPFTAMRNLYLSEEVALRVAPALKELTGERVAEVLPALQNLFLEEPQTPESPALQNPLLEEPQTSGPAMPAPQNPLLEEPQKPGLVQEATEQFAAARQLNGHPVVVHGWKRGQELGD